MITLARFDNKKSQNNVTLYRNQENPYKLRFLHSYIAKRKEI